MSRLGGLCGTCVCLFARLAGVTQQPVPGQWAAEKKRGVKGVWVGVWVYVCVLKCRRVCVNVSRR